MEKIFRKALRLVVGFGWITERKKDHYELTDKGHGVAIGSMTFVNFCLITVILIIK